MLSPVPAPRARVARHATTALAVAVAVLACSDGTAPGAAGPVSAPRLSRTAAGDPAVRVLNVQLRPVYEPGVEPSEARGHLQLKLTRNADGSVRVDWTGMIFNPGGETFTELVFSGASATRPTIRLALRPADGTSARIDVEATTVLSAEVAIALFGPDRTLVASALTTARPAGAIRGEVAVTGWEGFDGVAEFYAHPAPG